MKVSVFSKMDLEDVSEKETVEMHYSAVHWLKIALKLKSDEGCC